MPIVWRRVNMPEVSVLMTVYDDRETIGLAIESILSQTYQNLEVVIVDDGSSDGTAELVASYDDSRIRLVRLSSNQGRGSARLRAIAESSCDLLCWQDADDWSLPTRIEVQRRLLLEDPFLDAIATAAYLEYRWRKQGPLRYVLSPRARSNYGHDIVHPTLMFRKRCLLYASPAKAKSSEDRDFMSGLARRGRVRWCEAPLYVYRVRFRTAGRYLAGLRRRRLEAGSYPLWTRSVLELKVVMRVFALPLRVGALGLLLDIVRSRRIGRSTAQDLRRVRDVLSHSPREQNSDGLR